MGYDISQLRIPLRLDRHGGEEQAADDLAKTHLAYEIQLLIDSKPEYRRIAILGVEG